MCPSCLQIPHFRLVRDAVSSFREFVLLLVLDRGRDVFVDVDGPDAPVPSERKAKL